MNRKVRSCIGSLLGLVLGAVTLAQGQQFQSAVYYSVGPLASDPGDLVAGDVDGDGNLDLVVALDGPSVEHGVAMLLGNPDGSFQPAHFLSSAQPWTVALADFNEDGVLDFADLTSAGLTVFVSAGQQRYQRSAIVPEAYFPTSLAVADLNGDGHLDVAVVEDNYFGPHPGYVTLSLGRGDGTFQPATKVYWVGDRPWHIAAADINGDGFVDLVISDAGNRKLDENTLFIMLNNGDGTFRSGSAYQVGIEAIDVAVSDLNHDGAADLITVTASNEAIAVLLGNGDGTFAAPILYSTAILGAGPNRVAVADFNGDGNADIAVVLEQGDPGIFYGQGDGTFSGPEPIIINGSGASGAYGAVAGDFNHDGAADLAISLYGSNEHYLAVLLNTKQ